VGAGIRVKNGKFDSPIVFYNSALGVENMRGL
jgi:hypothetical protein